MTSALDLIPSYVRDRINIDDPHIRDDLKIIKAAEAAGWTVRFRDDSWHNSAIFEKASTVVWATGSDWRRDDLIDGRYSGKPTVFKWTMDGLREALSLTSLSTERDKS